MSPPTDRESPRADSSRGRWGQHSTPPACPDHSLKQIIFDLMGVGATARMSLTESFAMLPTASVSGLYCTHGTCAMSVKV